MKKRNILCAAVVKAAFSWMAFLHASVVLSAPLPPEASQKSARQVVHFKVAIDSSAAPELAEWCEQSLRPAMEKWYVEFCRRFPTKGWTPPKLIRVRFKDNMKVPAYAVRPGNVITLNHRRFVKTKSVGCVMHELFHIVQQYKKTPAWITEAMADYARYYVWSKKGCPMSTRNRRARSKYATGANFIAFVESRHPGTAARLNDVCRRGKYNEKCFWPDATKKTLDELERKWQESSPKHKVKRVVKVRKKK